MKLQEIVKKYSCILILGCSVHMSLLGKEIISKNVMKYTVEIQKFSKSPDFLRDLEKKEFKGVKYQMISDENRKKSTFVHFCIVVLFLD